MTREQSTVARTVAGPRKVKTRVVGQAKFKVNFTESVHVVATAIGGVAKTMDVVVGQEIVTAPVEAGNVKVVTVALGIVTETPMGVKYVVLVGRPPPPPPLLTGTVPGSANPIEGPPSIWGQGGRGIVREVSPPLPSDNGIITGGMLTLG